MKHAEPAATRPSVACSALPSQSLSTRALSESFICKMTLHEISVSVQRMLYNNCESGQLKTRFFCRPQSSISLCLKNRPFSLAKFVASELCFTFCHQEDSILLIGHFGLSDLLSSLVYLRISETLVNGVIHSFRSFSHIHVRYGDYISLSDMFQNSRCVASLNMILMTGNLLHFSIEKELNLEAQLKRKRRSLVWLFNSKFLYQFLSFFEKVCLFLKFFLFFLKS